MGCSHSVSIRESSATAKPDEITEHLKSLLNCGSLTLLPDGENRFSATGTNDSGGFTMTVTRTGEIIAYNGQYTNGTKGTFQGSTSWSHTVEHRASAGLVNWSQSNSTTVTTSSH